MSGRPNQETGKGLAVKPVLFFLSKPHVRELQLFFPNSCQQAHTTIVSALFVSIFSFLSSLSCESGKNNQRFPHSWIFILYNSTRVHVSPSTTTNTSAVLTAMPLSTLLAEANRLVRITLKISMRRIVCIQQPPVTRYP